MTRPSPLAQDRDHAHPVTRLGTGDVDVFRALRLAAMRRSPEAFNSTEAEELAKTDVWYRDRLSDDGIFIAGPPERPVGLVGFTRARHAKGRHKGTLYSLFVDPAARRRGVGRALVEAVITHAADAVEIVLLSVVTTNQPAIALYEAVGFERYGLEKRAMKGADGRYYDDLLMAYHLVRP